MEKDIVHEEEFKGLTIKIYHDYDCDSPEDWSDDGLFLVGYHRDFSVDHKGKIPLKLAREIMANEKDEHEFSNANEWRKTHHIFGLEAYIHSGVVLALSNEGNFCDRQWDVSQLGMVFASKEEWKTKEKARKAAQGLIETWNECLSGNVYGFVVEDKNGVRLDSCYGFYGDYEKVCLIEARNSAEYQAKEIVEEEKQKAKQIIEEQGQFSI